MKDEGGSVSVVLAAAITVVLVLTMGLADLAHVLAARSRARTAADAGALAVAQELAVPTGTDTVELANGYVAANGARLVGCVCAPGTHEAIVEAEVPAGDLILFPGSPVLIARARAVVDLPGP